MEPASLWSMLSSHNIFRGDAPGLLIILFEIIDNKNLSIENEIPKKERHPIVHRVPVQLYPWSSDDDDDES